MSDIIKTYNPANASALTSEQLNDLQNLDSNQIKELAKAYPNATMGRAYLLIIDKTKPVEKQLPSLSTFENLWNLREKNAMRQFVVYRFRDNYKPVQTANIKRGTGRKTEVLDLSETDLLNLPGFKTKDTEHPAQTVEVVKLNKIVPASEQEKQKPAKLKATTVVKKAVKKSTTKK